MFSSARRPTNRNAARLCPTALGALLIALRLFWMPVHLALETHAHDFHHDESFAHEHAEDAAHEHEDEGDEHAPHPAGDHLTELMLARAPQLGVLVWLPGGEISIAPTPVARQPLALESDAIVPRPPPPRASRARAPPVS